MNKLARRIRAGYPAPGPNWPRFHRTAGRVEAEPSPASMSSATSPTSGDDREDTRSQLTISQLKSL